MATINSSSFWANCTFIGAFDKHSRALHWPLVSDRLKKELALHFISPIFQHFRYKFRVHNCSVMSLSRV